jgi:hypothetical protein
MLMSPVGLRLGKAALMMSRKKKKKEKKERKEILKTTDPTYRQRGRPTSLNP